MKIQQINSANLCSVQTLPKVQTKTNANYSKINSISHYPFYNLNFTSNSKPPRELVLETIQTAKPLSDAGFKGVVYKFPYNQKDYVVKVARKPEFSFENEAQILSKIPTWLDNSQHLVDYFQTPDKKDVLVTDFVQGKKGILATNKQFRNFYQTLFALDNLGILHGDLNIENVLLQEDKINLIDYGEGTSFKKGECYDELYPDFVRKSNGVNFEHNGVTDYIYQWESQGLDSREQFKKLLKAKAHYYQDRLALFKDKKEAIISYDYEENLSQVLKNPSDRVIECEIRRVDTLHAMEEADTSVNYHKIPKDAKRNWSRALQQAKEALDFIHETLKSEDLSIEEKRYFGYQDIILSSIYRSYQDWSDGTIKWLDKVTSTKNPIKLSQREKELFDNRHKETTYGAKFCYDLIVN